MRILGIALLLGFAAALTAAEPKEADNSPVVEAFNLGEQLGELKAALKSATRLSKTLKDDNLKKELDALNKTASELDADIRNTLKKKLPLAKANTIALGLLTKSLETWTKKVEADTKKTSAVEDDRFNRNSLLEDLDSYFKQEDRLRKMLSTPDSEKKEKKK